MIRLLALSGITHAMLICREVHSLVRGEAETGLSRLTSEFVLCRVRSRETASEIHAWPDNALKYASSWSYLRLSGSMA